MPFAEGENIGPYRIIRQLGQGGMATVYKSYHAALDRYVALKVLHPAFYEDPTFTGRFQREARVVAKLEHPNIVPVYNFAEHEKRPYLVMKFIEGETLKARLSRGRLNAVEITQVVEAIGSALAYAHKQGILHRDIKPSNVLITDDNQIYLADFGLARIAQAGESTLSSDAIMGTPQYISPEQARGDKELDAGTDIYSFGVMLYEMVVGQVPFSADTPFSIIHDHIYTPLPLPRSINPNVPESVERVLLKALSKERADRYKDVPAMVQAFKAAWEGSEIPVQGTALTLPAVTAQQEEKSQPEQTTGADKPSGVEKITWEKKLSPWPFVAAGALLVICCVAVFFVWRANRLNRLVERIRAETPTQEVAVAPPLEPGPPGPTPIKPKQADLPPEVKEAQRVADANPGDPAAQLGLALAFWDAGRQRPAYETLNLAADLAGDNVGFLMDAGRQFHERQAWFCSASVYLRVLEKPEPGGDVLDEASNNFHEAVYMAAPMPEFETMMPPMDEILRVDKPIGMVGQARRAFLTGRHMEGKEILDQIKQFNPDFPEASLLEAEIAMNENRFDNARQILSALIDKPETPAWVRVMAEEFRARIP